MQKRKKKTLKLCSRKHTPDMFLRFVYIYTYHHRYTVPVYTYCNAVMMVLLIPQYHSSMVVSSSVMMWNALKNAQVWMKSVLLLFAHTLFAKKYLHYLRIFVMTSDFYLFCIVFSYFNIRIIVIILNIFIKISRNRGKKCTYAHFFY